MPYKTIVLKRGKAESLRRFHPWVFSGAIQTLPDDLREGEIVRVEDVSSQFLAVGHYQIGSIELWWQLLGKKFAEVYRWFLYVLAVYHYVHIGSALLLDSLHYRRVAMPQGTSRYASYKI